MGANQSSDAGGSSGSRGYVGEVQRSYYEVLGVGRQASEDEIKKAYRKKALESHPDRNYGNVEETTKQFATVQSAYEILSDRQERAWYDTHRDAILRNEETTSKEHYDHNVRTSTADDILRLFTQFHGKIEYSDSARGFYAVLRKNFETIAEEEKLACVWQDLEPIMYPSFGHANDSREDVAKPFYTMWDSFATKKTFSWADVYRYSDAPDRRARRLMEKENKRLREESIREFNDAVRSLVAFVKKRDPRFKPNGQTEVERQKILKDAARAQAARSRAFNQAKNVLPKTIPEWMRSSDTQEDNISDEEEEEEEKSVDERFQCVVCDKGFKSEKQYEAHEKSKKHIKAVQYLRLQMQREDKNLSLDKASEQGIGHPRAISTDQSDVASENEIVDGKALAGQDQSNDEAHDVKLEGTGDSGAELRGPQDESPAKRSRVSGSSSQGDEYASREKVEDRILGQNRETGDLRTSRADINDLADRMASESLQTGSNPDKRPKLGKAKEKRAKKAAQKSAATAASGRDLKCATCQAGFPSKTRLFDHIKDFGHAQPVLKPGKGGKGKKF